ncbi:MAG: DNA adenine methylase [Collinsella sp.]
MKRPFKAQLGSRFPRFIWKSYSPASASDCGIERRYFTEDNALKIDGIRELIATWKDQLLIDDAAEILLIADLIEAANDVANIAGTYGCFLKKWTAQSSGALVVRPRELFPLAVDSIFRVGDVFTLETSPSDIVYLDPPYTKRQYASYYHIPETIAYHDEPAVEGVAGLRPWKKMASPFCYKTKALNAILECIAGLDAKRVFLSYSSQGHVSLDDLLERLAECGNVTVHELGEIGRYRPNRIAAQGGDSVQEYLIQVDKGGRH